MKKGFWTGLTLGAISAAMLMQNDGIKNVIEKLNGK